MATTITRPSLTDDTGNGLSGDVLNAALLYDLLDRIDALLAGALVLDGVQTTPNQPRAGLFHSTTQSLANDTLAAVLFDSEEFDVGAMHSPSVNTSRITIPAGAGGLYLVTAKICFATNTSGYRQARIRKGGAEVCTLVNLPPVTGAATVMLITALLTLVAGEYVEAWAYQNSGGALNIGDAAVRAIQNEFNAVKLA